MDDITGAVFRGMGAAVKGTVGVANAVVNGISRRHHLRKIAQANQMNQGITEYNPSQIEAFFEDNEPLSNVVLSGGDNTYRSRAIARIADCAQTIGTGAVIIHVANHALEQQIRTYFGSQAAIINGSNPVYDPFLGLSNAEIIKMVVSSTKKGFEIQGQGRYYIEGMCDFIRSKKTQPYGAMLISCPHFQLVDKIDEAEQNGLISATTAKALSSQIMQGSSEKGNIEYFFQAFGSEAQSILASNSNIVQSISIRSAVGNNRVICLDITSPANSELISIVISEIELLLSRGKKVMLLADNISLASSAAYQAMIHRSGVDCLVSLSADDVFALFNGEEKNFYAFTGNSSKVVASKHTSAYSCQKIADVFGSYDKIEVNPTFTQHSGYFGHVHMGGGESLGTGKRRENIVKPEEISRMSTNEVYVQSKAKGELAHFQII